MDKKQIQVVLIETFQGKKYVLRTDREYEEPLMKLLKSLFKKAPLGSLAHISLRVLDEKDYNEMNASVFMEQEGIKNGKENNKKN